MKLTPKKAAELASEEKKSAKEYGKLGLPALAKDESKHAAFLKKLSKKR
jgi:hypothetical protein